MKTADDRVTFRSRQERDAEIELERNYRSIGSRAVLAAAQACAKVTPIVTAPQRPVGSSR